METLGGESDEVKDNLCLLCQKRTTEKTCVLHENGWNALQNATTIRRELFDTENAQIIDKVSSISCFADNTLVYHKSCYDSYTNKTKLDRLKNKVEKAKKSAKEPVLPESRRTLRSDVAGQTFDKKLCIICQEDKNTEHIRNAATFPVSNRMEAIAKFDYTLKRRMTYAFDAMAGDMRYHTYCLINKEREVEKTRHSDKDSNASFLQLCFELHTAAAKGQVVTLEAAFQRYVALARDVGEEVPPSYISRRSTFRTKLESQLRDVFQFFRPLNRDSNERDTLLISHKFQNKAAVDQIYEGEESPFPSYQPQAESGFTELVHVALRLRSDLKIAASGLKHGIGITKEDVASVVPESVFMFLSLLFGGNDCLSNAEDVLNGNLDSTIPPDRKNTIISVAQDWIYIASRGRKLTPKHIGLALTLHQRTRSKELVTLFNKAGHCASYDQVLQLETAMGQVSLQTLDSKTGAVVPVNLKAAPVSADGESIAPILNVTADNVDIQMDTLDGKRSFHATQMVAFQRGGGSLDEALRGVVRSKDRCLKIPEALNTLIPSPVPVGKVEPVFKIPVKSCWYKPEDPPVKVQEAQTIDAAFLLHREHADVRVGWTEFNKNLSSKDREICNAGYMPLILNPAHETTTLNTVLERCLSIANKLGHKFVVLTVDQQLYCQLAEMKWSKQEFLDRIVLRMGGLHITLNFLKGIGQHMSGCGLLEAWVESGVVAEKSGLKVLEGKAYSKGMRLHKLTLQAIWRILEPAFFEYLKNENPLAFTEIQKTRSSLEDLLPLLYRYNITELISKFANAQTNVNMQFWLSYLKMVFTLLQFTRSMREGLWDLYMFSLSEILPVLARYDHHNYLKSMSVYLAEMKQLPPEIEAAFKMGEFVVKRSRGRFNEVDPDHAQEWIVGDGKESSGMVGLIQHDSALQRWALTYSWLGEVCNETKAMFDIGTSNAPHSQPSPSRRSRDQTDEDNLLQVFLDFDIFDLKHPDSLRNIATKDVATQNIRESLLNVEKEGRDQVIKFVEERLCFDKTVSFHHSVTLNRPLTFNDLYKSQPFRKQTAERRKVREDRSILQRVIVAFEAGRDVNLPAILQHELSDVPLALAETDGSLRSGSKADLLKLVTKDVASSPSIDIQKQSSHLIIDGQALVMSIGMPQKAKTFYDFFFTFRERVKAMGAKYSRVDIAFDRYMKQSTKSGTRVKRTASCRAIRKNIDSGNVPLPKNWSNFISLADNKAELARYLSQEMIAHPVEGIDIVVAGGFEDATSVASTNPNVALDTLQATHEEADTRVLLHAVHSPYRIVVVSARDTDIFLILLHHFKSMSCSECWMMAGTSKDRRYVPVHEVHRSLPRNLTDNVLAFHALTGCDTTSYLATIGKRGAYAAFKKYSDLLSGLGVLPLTESALKRAEEFIVRLYGVEKARTSDDARHILFGKVKTPEALPPTSDALKQHILRAHYQTRIWRTANEAAPYIPPVTENGWKVVGDDLKPMFMTLEPVPKACVTLVSCGCKKGCTSNMCKCRRSGLLCTHLCRCQGACCNGKDTVISLAEDSDSDASLL